MSKLIDTNDFRVKANGGRILRDAGVEVGTMPEAFDAAADEIDQLRKSLARCLKEAEELLDEAHGCKPEEVMDYDGWADDARRLLVASDDQGTIKEQS